MQDWLKMFQEEVVADVVAEALAETNGIAIYEEDAQAQSPSLLSF